MANKNNEVPLFECDCWYEPHHIFEEKVIAELKFVDCEPVPISDFSYIFKTTANLPRIGELVCNRSWDIDNPDYQYRVVEIKTVNNYTTRKVFYLKQLSAFKKESEDNQTIVNL